LERSHSIEDSTMTIPKSPAPRASDDDQPAQRPDDEEPGTNAVEHEPDPHARPIPDGEHKYVRRSPYTAGNT
jgi:hypothetical protein